MNTSVNKKRKIFFLSLLIILSLVASVFVTLIIATEIVRSRPYLFENNVRWVSSDPYFVLEYRYVDGDYFESAVLETNGELQEVFVDYQGGTFIVTPPATEAINYADRLLEGTWRYRRDKLVFYIDYDSVFDGAYKEIVFEPEALTDQDIQP